MNKNYDFIISGAGLVGAISALQLSKKGYDCCLIEKNYLPIKKKHKDFAPLSLNYRSFLILKKFGLWDEISKYAYPINTLNIKSFNSLNRISFNSNDIGLDVLGYVVDRRSLLSSFLSTLSDNSKVTIIENNYIDGINLSGSKKTPVSLNLNSKDTMNSKYLIVSDGVNSKIKDILDIKSQTIDYCQNSFVYNVNGSFEKNTAVQIFNKYGIFAGIPGNSDTFNLVMSINKQFENKFFKNKLLDTDLLESIYKGYACEFHNINFVSKYPLVTSRSDKIVQDNILLLGNSSQLLHPVGAQGFNLALRNVNDMINFLDKGSDFTSLSSLIYSDRERTFSNIDFATNILANTRLPSRILSLAACNLIKSSSFIKSQFLENILGIKNYPYLSVGIK